MNAESDHQLLRAYAVRRDEAAFRELVQRHTNFIYSAALRQVDSDAVARDLTQSVFTDLARRAPDILGKHTGDSLAGWLHRATRYAALNHLRDARRRHDNERQAMEQLLTNSDSSADWEQIRPVLDEALDALDDTDREALLLRYFKNHDFRTVGAQLGVSDDAAQKRVSRAVERLREFFAKRGVSVGAGGLVVVISANAVQAAPVGLAFTISAAALAGTAATTSTLIATTTKTIAMTTLQKTLITATVAVLAGAGIYEARQAAQLRDQVQTLQQQQAPLVEQIQQLQNERDDATRQIVWLKEELAKNDRNNLELLKLRGQVTALRNQSSLQKNRGDLITSDIQGKSEEEWIRSIVYNGDEAQIKLWLALGTNGIQMLIGALDSNTHDRETRMRAASLLNQLHGYEISKVAIPKLINLIQFEKQDSVRAIELAFFEGQIEKMDKVDKEALFPELLRAMQSGDSAVRNNAIVAMQFYPEQKDEIVPVFENSLKDSDAYVRLMAAKAMNKIDPEAADKLGIVNIVARCTKEESSANEAIRFLGELHRQPEVAVPALIQGLQNPAHYIRNNSASALGKFGKVAQEAIPALEQALQDSDSDVRKQAATALKLIR